MNPASPRQFRVAFTLLELLVTISIIAMLMLITVPVIRAVRAGAQTTLCTSNIRQCGIALLTYAADFEGRIDARSGGGHFGNAGSWEDTLLNAGFFQKHTTQYADGGIGTHCPTAHGPTMGPSTANAYLGHFAAYDNPPGDSTAPWGPSSDGNGWGHLATVAQGRANDSMLMEYSRVEWVFGYNFWSYGNHWDNTGSPRSLALFWWDGHATRARADRNEINGFYEIWIPSSDAKP